MIRLFLLLILLSSCAHPYKDKTIIAHRGASGYLPEHTLEAVALAHGFNPDFIEPDIVITKDNRAIILHDIHLEGNTDVEKKYPRRKRKDGRWYPIDFTLKEIKKLNVHERAIGNKPVFSGRFPYGRSRFKVPTLEEYIELVQGLNISRNKNIGIYPEIKAPAFHKKNGKDALAIVMKILVEYGYNKAGAPIFLQCFDPDLLLDFKKRWPNSPIKLVQLIAHDSWGESSHNYAAMMTEQGMKKIALYANGIGPWMPFILKPSLDQKSFERTKLIKMAHKNNLVVHAYTLRNDSLPKYTKDSKSLLTELFKAGADGIFTDFVETTVKTLRN
jgi:glycerophosphoryl diester phosphodiesterase